MTRILVQRGSSGPSSSSNSNRASSSSLPSSSTTAPSQPQANISQVIVVKDDDVGEEVQEHLTVNNIVDFSDDDGDNNKAATANDFSLETSKNSQDTGGTIEVEKTGSDDDMSKDLTRVIGEMKILDRESEGSSSVSMCSYPPPPPIPPPKPSSGCPNSRRNMPGGSNSPRLGSSRRATAWPVVPVRSSPTGSRPSSPRSHGDAEGYNSADEQNPSFGICYDDAERERQFEIDIRRAKGLEVRKMMEDGNCLFRAVADQVYGDCEGYDLVRQMCIDYMERERDHFSQFITEGFTSYCKRKRRDKVYGNNMEIQALAEMYNRPIHIYSYTTEPINIFQGSYDTDTPPIRLSFHHGNHYNSLVDPRRLTIGAGLGFSSLRGRNADKDQVKAAIKAQQDQQIDNALLAEGRFYSDLELTEKEIERMVMEASRAEYIADDKFKQQLSCHKSSTSSAEPSSSGARPSVSEAKADKETESESKEGKDTKSTLSSSMQIVLSMGFSYLQAIEAYSIFGDDVDSMVCYLLETGNSSRRSKGKATE